MFETIGRRFRAWRQFSVTYRRLALLDDRLLADIGAERASIAEFIAGKLEGQQND